MRGAGREGGGQRWAWLDGAMLHGTLAFLNHREVGKERAGEKEGSWYKRYLSSGSGLGSEAHA